VPSWGSTWWFDRQFNKDQTDTSEQCVTYETYQCCHVLQARSSFISRLVDSVCTRPLHSTAGLPLVSVIKQSFFSTMFYSSPNGYRFLDSVVFSLDLCHCRRWRTTMPSPTSMPFSEMRMCVDLMFSQFTHVRSFQTHLLALLWKLYYLFSVYACTHWLRLMNLLNTSFLFAKFVSAVSNPSQHSLSSLSSDHFTFIVKNLILIYITLSINVLIHFVSLILIRSCKWRC